jgi:hypothetical protein
MAKVWVLDTETKGTGATMVPLERVLRRPTAEPELATVEFERPPRRPPPAPAPPEPRRFRVVDVRSRRVLGDELDTRAALGVLRGVASVVDVHVHVWQPDSGRWRLLTHGEQQSLWRLRDATPAATP